MSDQKSSSIFSSFRRRSSSRRTSQQEEVEESPRTSEADLSAYGQNSYGSISNDSVTDAELGGIGGLVGGLGLRNISAGDMILSPQSSTSDSRTGSGRALAVMSPLEGSLMGEHIMDTDGEEDHLLDTDGEEDDSLLPLPPPPRLNLPPTVPQPRGAVKTYPEVYQTSIAGVGGTTPRGGGAAASGGGGRVPSSVNAQPGDWHSVGLSYGSGTGNGGGGASNGSKDITGNGITTATTNAAPSIWSTFSSNNSKNGPFAVIVRIFVILALLILATLLAVIMSSSNSGWWWSSGSGRGPGSASGSSARPALVVPFPHVDRAAYGDPANKIVNPDLFDPRLLGVTPSFRTRLVRRTRRKYRK